MQPLQTNVSITLYMLLFIPLYWIITNASTTDTTWPSYNLLRYLLLFPTNHNLGFIHIYSHTSILHVILPLIKLLIRSSLVSAVTTMSYAYNNSHCKATLNSVHCKVSMKITNSKGLNAEPWCIPTFTSKPLLLPRWETPQQPNFAQWKRPPSTICGWSKYDPNKSQMADGHCHHLVKSKNHDISESVWMNLIKFGTMRHFGTSDPNR